MPALRRLPRRLSAQNLRRVNAPGLGAALNLFARQGQRRANAYRIRIRRDRDSHAIPATIQPLNPPTCHGYFTNAPMRRILVTVVPTVFSV